MSSGRNTHWCYHCSRAIRLLERSLACPYCNEGFIEELPDILASDARRPSLFGEQFDNRRLGIADALSEIMRQRRALRDPNFGIRSIPDMLSGSNAPGPRTRVRLFQGQSTGTSSEDPFELLFNNGIGMGRRQTDFNNLFTNSGLQELFEQLSMNERRSPPPAPRSAIDAMPTIKITQKHINTDAHCPVCQDKFELGCKARQMPCDHIYHSNCIVPWLVEHNSCPVCRIELPCQNAGSEVNQRSNDQNRSVGTSSRGDNQSRWNPFSFMWPSNS